MTLNNFQEPTTGTTGWQHTILKPWTDQVVTAVNGKVDLPSAPSAASVLTVAPDGSVGTAQLTSVVPGMTVFRDTQTGALFIDPDATGNTGGDTQPPQPPTQPPVGVTYPAQVLDLRAWKETLPTNTAHTGAPDEYVGSELQTFVDAKYFYPRTNADGTNVVVFMAPVDGYATSNSAYPRSELREMAANADGTLKTSSGSPVNAAWSTSDGLTHTMLYEIAFETTPKSKPQVVGGQIHDSSSDIIEILRDDSVASTPTITYRFMGQTQATRLLTNYTPGSYIWIKVVVTAGTIKLYCVDMANSKVTITKSGSSWYFKCGCYTQANLTNAKTGELGQTSVRNLTITHA